jgi:hypothetical protein
MHTRKSVSIEGFGAWTKVISETPVSVSRVNTIIRNTKICISNNCKKDRVINTPIPLLIRGFQNFFKERMAGRTTDIFPSAHGMISFVSQ